MGTSSIMDVAPTLARLLGVEPPPSDGRPIAELCGGPAAAGATPDR
jgi:arylsulfatase A-like enzyme